MEQFLFALALSATSGHSTVDLSIRPEFYLSEDQCIISVIPEFDPSLLPEARKARLAALLVNGDITTILPRDMAAQHDLMRP